MRDYDANEIREFQVRDHGTPCGARHKDGGKTCPACKAILANLHALYSKQGKTRPA